MTCTNCDGNNTVTHYFHIASSGDPHDFEIQDPPVLTMGGPIPQPCPIDGCIRNTQRYDAEYSYCLDCGNIF